MPAETLHAVLDQGAGVFTFGLAFLLETAWLAEHFPNVATSLQELHDLEPAAKRRAVLLGTSYALLLALGWKWLSPNAQHEKKRLRIALKQ